MNDLASHEKHSSQSEAAAPRARILLVDDEADVRQIIFQALTGRQFEVLEARSDTEAYDVLVKEARRLDVLVADINLGEGTTGFDVARRGRQLNPRLKVIYITGHAAHVDRFGVEGGLMFPKPFYPEELADQVEALL